MSSSRTPTHKTATKMPSFASCFRATLPLSPQQAGGPAASLAGITYSRLQLDDFDDEDQCGYGARGKENHGHLEKLYIQHLRQGTSSTMKLGNHSSFKERPARRSETLYASEGEQDMARERTGALKLGKQRAMRQKAGSGWYSASEAPKNISMYESEGENYEYRRQTKNVMLEAMRKKAEIGVYHKTGELSVKTGSQREKAPKEGVQYVEVGDSSRRASFGTKMREACVQVLETARRGSPHLSELFVGNQLLMQVTASSFNARNMAPSYGFHVFTPNPSIPVTLASPARSTSSSV